MSSYAHERSKNITEEEAKRAHECGQEIIKILDKYGMYLGSCDSCESITLEMKDPEHEDGFKILSFYQGYEWSLEY